MENISFITLTNDGYKHYTLNCLTSLKKIGLGEKLKVYCLGDNAYQDIKTNHNNCIKMENSDNLDKMFSYNDKGWNLITYNKFNIIHKELLENEFVCFTDGDIVYENNDIFKYCLKHIKGCELLIQRDDLGNDKPINIGNGKLIVPTVCSGFMFIRRTENTLKMFNRKNINPNFLDDQEYMNNVIQKFNYKKLPLSVYPNGLYYKMFRDKIKPYMIHFNYTETAKDKKAIMKKYGKWYF